jgi:hypothetical protein
MIMRVAIGGTVALLVLAGVAHGSVVACSTAAPGTNLNSLGLNSLSNGCAEIDKSFTNFNITNTTFSAPPASDVFAYATGTPPVGNSISPVSLILNTPGPGATWRVANGNSMSETVDYVVTAHTGGAFSGGSYPTPSTPGLIWAINQIVLTPSISIQNFGGGTNNHATITLSFCLNATNTTGCSAPNSGSIVATYSGTTTAVYSCTFSGCVSGTSNTVNLTGSVTQIAFAESLSIAAATPIGNTVTINNITNQFGEFAATGVPEPSTFFLIGLGLVCLGLFGRRYKI